MTPDSDLTAVAIANWNAAIDACAILVEVNQPLVADDMRKLKRFADDIVVEIQHPTIAWLAKEIIEKASAMMTGQTSYLQHIAKCAETIQDRLSHPSTPDWSGFDQSPEVAPRGSL